MRGAFTHRRGEQPEDERLAAEFWIDKGFAVEREGARDLFSREPDLRLRRDGVSFAYCEVKTVWRHVTRTRIFHEDRSVEERSEFSKETVEERLTADLVTAARQLLYANPDHAVFNFVQLIIRDAEASPDQMAGVLRRLPTRDGTGLAASAAAELDKFRCNVDLCLWARPVANGKLLVERCFLFNPSLLSFAEEITGLRGDKLVSLEPAA